MHVIEAHSNYSQLQAHLGSYKRIAICVPDEFLLNDEHLPDGDVMRSQMLLKFLPIHDSTLDDADELEKRIVVGYD